MKAMKKTSVKMLLALLTISSALTACNKEDEVVPLNDRNTVEKYYKAPDPVLLSDEEQDEVQAIRDEYRNATQ
jgi:hypothetical protein